VTATEEAELRRRMDGLLQSVPLSAVPLEEIIGRGKGIRLRRAGAAAGGLSLAGMVAAAIVLVLRMLQAPAFPVTIAPSGAAAPGGVFASGTANGHAWRLAVQNIADPGQYCLPAITINGTDADPVAPAADSGAAVSLGSDDPGVYFAFIQLPANVDRIILDGRETLPAVQVTACGEHYRLVGFASPLNPMLALTVFGNQPGQPASVTLPIPSISPPPPVTTSQTAGLWNNVGQTRDESASAIIGSGQVSGDAWSIRLVLGSSGDCYAFEFGQPSSAGNNAQMGACGPVGTPSGPETIMALPLADPGLDIGATGYAVQVSPSTAHLRATLSDGSSELVTPQVVAGRKYVAFVAGDSLRLNRLTWLNAAGQAIASSTGLPRYGYTQFQP
jgi:hypothetical protein